MSGADDALLHSLVLLLLGVGLARAVTSLWFRYALYRTAYRIESDLRSILYTHLTRLSFSFFDRMQSGQVISRANSDIRSVQMFLVFSPIMLMSLLSFSLAIGYMLSVSVGLTLAAVISLPGVFFMSLRLRRIMFPLSWIVQSRTADVATIVDENINGQRIVKSFAREEEQIGVLAASAQKLRWAQMVMADIRARYAPLIENIAAVGQVAVLFYGGWLVMEGQIALGALVSFNMYIIMLQAPFRILGFLLMMGQRAAASARRIYEVLDEEPEIVDRPGAVDLVRPRGHIVFDQVRFAYAGSEPVLRDVRFEVRPGEAVAIVGRTGCGKSTIARLLSRYYELQAGRILIDGQDIRTLTLLSLRHHIGMVLDEPFLFSAPIRDNIAYGKPDATDEEVIAAARTARAHDFIMAMEDGYDTVVGERGYTLSGGQRQRIGIARTVLMNPPVLVLDDATSAIDVQTEAGIHDDLKELMAERTTIIIAHRLSTISLADRVLFMEEGRIAAAGTHPELMAGVPEYASIFNRHDDADGAEPAADAFESDREFRLRIRRSLMQEKPPADGMDVGGLI